YLASAYMKAGDYASVVKLLRANMREGLSEEDEGNYLTALTKLAPKSAEYRKELGSYAASRLNAKLPAKRKLALIYALIAAGQIEPAMPHIRELAMREGGQWAWLYAEQLEKQG